MVNKDFSKFLEKIQDQNQRSFVTQLLELKYEREVAGEDNDRREEQLDEVISGLFEVKKAVTGVNIDLDITPLVSIGENQTALLSELSKEASLIRKLTEGSVEYDRGAAQYRNTSGREIESVVTGKTSKKGGFLDFETARDTLSGQSTRVRTDNKIQLKPISYSPKASQTQLPVSTAATEERVEAAGVDSRGFFKTLIDEVRSTPGRIFDSMINFTPSKGNKEKAEAKVSSPRQVSPNSDNIESTGEAAVKVSEQELQISNQLLSAVQAQLTTLKEIRDALAPKTPTELQEQKPVASTTPEVAEAGAGSSGVNLNIGLPGKGKKVPGKVAKGLGGKILGGFGKAARFLGPAAVIAGASYSGFEGYQNTNQNFDIEEGKQATTGQKISSTLGGVASGLTFGLLNEKTAAQGIHKVGSSISNWVSDKNVPGAIGDVASKVGGAASNLGGMAVDKAKSIGSSISSWAAEKGLPTTMNGVASAGTGLFDKLKSGVSSAAQTFSIPSVRPTAGSEVAKTTIENTDMVRQSTGTISGSTIISNNVNNTNTTKYVPIKATPRPEYTGSALDRYTSRISVY